MKYFLDTEFIEGFKKPAFCKRRHVIDLIQIGIVDDEGTPFRMLSNEYDYNDADEWVKKNVIEKLYISYVHGDNRNRFSVSNFHKHYGQSNQVIKLKLLEYFKCWRDSLFWRAPEGIHIYGYYCDYDWVLFCSLFGRMIDLPKGFPMYCHDLKQKMFDNGIGENWKRENCPDPEGEHDALIDAKWNKKLFETIQSVI